VIRAAATVGLVALAAMAAGAGPAAAQPSRPAPPTAIALSPLSTLGSEDTSAVARQIDADLSRELAAVSDAKVIGSAEVAEATRKAKKPLLRACDGDARCLAELGNLVGASHVVFAEVGGLGDVHVVYLELVDAATGKEVRRTQVSLSGDAEGGMRGGVVRLLAPERFNGRLVVSTKVKDAIIYVDGRRVGKSPSGPIELPVGAHALRVTHPEHRDYVRFVDIAFDADTPVDVDLVAYRAIESELDAQGNPVVTPNTSYVDTPPPWYRRWWAVAGFSAVVLTGAVVVGVATAGGIDSDASGTVKPP